jgi:hypothetical protein
MSQENVELARRVYAVIRIFLERATAGEDISQAPEYWAVWDPDVVIVEIAEYPDASTYRGHEEIVRGLYEEVTAGSIQAGSYTSRTFGECCCSSDGCHDRIRGRPEVARGPRKITV